MRPLAVFDIDGTLVDSRASILQAATEAARDLGLPDPHYDRVRQIVGLSLPQALAVLEPDLGPDELERFTEAFREAVEARVLFVQRVQRGGGAAVAATAAVTQQFRLSLSSRATDGGMAAAAATRLVPTTVSRGKDGAARGE
jgi:phosphoglycolate phosphatase